MLKHLIKYLKQKRVSPNRPLKKQFELTEEDKQVIAKYALDKLSKQDPLQTWLANWSYKCYQVEKNTNISINKSTNLVMVMDRWNSYEYESSLMQK